MSSDDDSFASRLTLRRALRRSDNDAPIIAVRRGISDTVGLLLAYGASTLVQKSWAETLLMVAASEGHSDIVQTLLSRTITRIDIKVARGNSVNNAAPESGDADLVKCLLEEGRFSDRSQALHEACRSASGRGLVNVQTLLLREPSIDFNTMDSEGCACIHLAAAGSQIRAVQLLLARTTSMFISKVDMDDQHSSW